MIMGQQNNAKPKPKLQVYVSRMFVDNLKNYASNEEGKEWFAKERALRAYLNMERMKL